MPRVWVTTARPDMCIKRGPKMMVGGSYAEEYHVGVLRAEAIHHSNMQYLQCIWKFVFVYISQQISRRE